MRQIENEQKIYNVDNYIVNAVSDNNTVLWSGWLYLLCKREGLNKNAVLMKIYKNGYYEYGMSKIVLSTEYDRQSNLINV